MPQGWGISLPRMAFLPLRQTGDLSRSRLASVARLSLYLSSILAGGPFPTSSTEIPMWIQQSQDPLLSHMLSKQGTVKEKERIMPRFWVDWCP